MGKLNNIIDGFLNKFLANSELIRHTVSLGIFCVFAFGYIKAVYLAHDFPPLDWGWVITLSALAGIQHLPEITQNLTGKDNGKNKIAGA